MLAGVAPAVSTTGDCPHVAPGGDPAAMVANFKRERASALMTRGPQFQREASESSRHNTTAVVMVGLRRAAGDPSQVAVRASWNRMSLAVFLDLPKFASAIASVAVTHLERGNKPGQQIQCLKCSVLIKSIISESYPEKKKRTNLVQL